MWLGSERAIAETSERFGHQRGAHFGQAFGKLRRGFGWGDCSFALLKNVAGVHASVNAHGGDAGDGFAVGDGPLDRSGAAISWKQGSVEIDPAEARNRQQARSNDLAVGNDNDGVGVTFAEKLFGFGSADFFGLEDRKVSGESDFLYRRKGDLLAAAAGAVRLSDDGGDLEVGLGEEVLETWNCERRCAAEQDAHRANPLARSARLILHRLKSVPLKPSLLPLALFFQFFDFAFDEVAFEHAEVLKEQDAVEVVDFVAESTSEKVFAADFERLPL